MTEPSGRQPDGHKHAHGVDGPAELQAGHTLEQERKPDYEGTAKKSNEEQARANAVSQDGASLLRNINNSVDRLVLDGGNDDEIIAMLLRMAADERNQWFLKHCPDSSSAASIHQQVMKRVDPSIALGKFLYNLAKILHARSKNDGNSEELRKALDFATRAAIEIPLEDKSEGIDDLTRLCEATGNSFAHLLHSGTPEDVDSYIRCCQQVVDLTPDEYDEKARRLGTLGHALATRFYRFGDVHDIDSALILHKKAVNLTPDHHPDKPARINQYGIAIGLRFQRLGELQDIDKAIQVQQQAVSLTPDGHPEKAQRLGKLGVLHNMRFTRLGRPDDCDKAICMNRQMIAQTPDNHPDKSRRLNDLGVALIARYHHFGGLDSLNESISLHKQAVDLPDNHIDKPRQLTNLGFALSLRFERFGKSEDIDEAIKIQKRAVGLSSKADLNKPERLNNLGTAYLRRFERFGDAKDVDAAATFLQQSVQLTPDSHPGKPASLTHFANALSQRYVCRGDPEDLDRAIETYQQALDLTPDGHPDKPLDLCSLAMAFRQRFDRFDDPKDINASIALFQQGVDLTASDNPDKPRRLTNLGVALDDRFMRFQELKDIDRAITAHQQAVDLSHIDHPMKPVNLSHLGISLIRRFYRLRNSQDVEAAIISHRNAVSLTHQKDISRARHLTNLVIALNAQYELTKELPVIDEVIAVCQEAVDLSPDWHDLKIATSINLAAAYVSRFLQSDSLDDIDSGITIYNKALDGTPMDHPDRYMILSCLGKALNERFSHTEEVEVLIQAVAAHRCAVALCPDGHPGKTARLNELVAALENRYKKSDDPNDLDEAITALHAAASADSGPPLVRFQAARKWAWLVKSEFKLEPHHAIMNLIPRIVWLGSTVQQRFNDLQQRIGDAVLEAGFAACVARELGQALEWLEQGRSIVWGQILQLRSPIDTLSAVRPDLADELTRTALQLEAAGTQTTQILPNPESKSIERRAQEHRRTAEKWEKLLEEVRAIPGFADFLQPKKASVLVHAAKTGPIIVVNACQSGCDALVLQPGLDSVGHVRLGSLSLDKLEKAQHVFFRFLHFSGVRARGAERMSVPGGTNMRNVLGSVLRMLWNDVVKPILNYLGYLPSPGECLPCITWCLTGPLASLPIHAAGDYDQPGPEMKLYSYAVSSFIPSITTLLETPKYPLSKDPSLLAITQTSTPGLSGLPGTLKEVDGVEEQLKQANRQVTRLDGEKAAVEFVSQQMNVHNWVHFSCHGSQDAREPIKSAFHLHDGTLELGEIMKKPLRHAELAYLSACQTASGDEKLPDEAVHLAAGMFIAGYDSVVATLWSIRDNEAPMVAGAFYKYLLANPEASTARALHHAVSLLREKNEKDFLSWVPYIHFGH